MKREAESGKRGAEKRGEGFSLVEVCLALMVLALGLLSLFTLFPSGLKSTESASGETRISLFAENVLGGISANASTVTTWLVWSNDTRFKTAALADLVPAVFQTGLTGTPRTVEFPVSSGQTNLRYRLDVTNRSSDRRLRYVTLQAEPGRVGSFMAPHTFYTELYYGGM